MQIKDIMRTEFHAFNINDTLSACESMDRLKLYELPSSGQSGVLLRYIYPTSSDTGLN